MNKDELIRPVNFETGEIMYFDPFALQVGKLVQVTREEAERLESLFGSRIMKVTKVDTTNKSITFTQEE